MEAHRGGRLPPPVDAARPSSVRSGTHPSMSVEQAAKPSFQIYVGDPVKIGDLTSSHIVYSVRTKVSIMMTLPSHCYRVVLTCPVLDYFESL